MYNGKPIKYPASSAIAALQESFEQRTFNAGGLKLEHVGTANDTVSGSLISTIKQTLRDAGLAKLVNAGRGFRSRPGDNLRPLRFENAEDIDPNPTEDTQNEEILMTEAQERAGIIAAAIADNPAEWAKKTVDAMSGTTISNYSDVNYRSEGNTRLAMEAFDDSNFRDAAAFSVTWNIVAARQSPGIENIWQTITLNPDQVWLEAAVTFQVFHDQYRHKSSGEEVDFRRILLIETIVNGDILDQNLIKCVPVYDAATNADHFAPPTVIPTRIVKVENEDIPTAPLKVGMTHGIIGLSQAAIAGLINELNSTTQLAPMPGIENLYLKIVNKTGVASYIRLAGKDLPRSKFTHVLEGNIRDVQLSMIVDGLGLDANTVDLTGAPAKALDFLRQTQFVNHRLLYRLKAYGDGNLEFGNLSVTAGPIEVTGVQVKVAAAHYSNERDKTIADELKDNIKSITLEYFDPDASRTNLTRLQRGPLTNVTTLTERYAVDIGSPISTVFPAIESYSNVDLMAPLTATRIKNDYRALKRLFECADLLASQAVSQDAGAKALPIRAIARHVVRPYYRHYTVSVLDILDSSRSKNKIEDMKYAILNMAQDAIIHMMRDSRAELALQVHTGSTDSRHTMAMLTNNILGKYLFQIGDTRILGSLPYPVIGDTHHSELLGKYGTDVHELFIVPVLEGVLNSPHSFGYHLYKPESASTLQVTRGDETQRELVIVPYNAWHMFLPCMIRITVKDLTLALSSKTELAIRL